MMDGPVFVKIEDYKDVNEIVAQITKKINESKQLVENIEKIKKEEDLFLDKWRQSLTKLENRVSNINGMMYNVKY